MSDLDFTPSVPVKKGYKYLWVEKYRPDSIAKIVLPNSTSALFKKFIEEKQIPNLFFFSSAPGTGKTSTARALLNNCGYEYKYINTSLDNGIDVVRTQITRYASSFSFEDKPKAVILDEFDGASMAFQQALRALIEEHEDRCRFIIVCNYKNMIIDPLKSRLQAVDFNYGSKKEKAELLPKFTKRLRMILNNESVKFNPETLDTFAESMYPDVRKMVNTLQLFSKKNDVVTDDILDFCSVDDEFIDLITRFKYTAVKQYVVDKSYNYDDLYTLMFEQLIPKVDKRAIPELIFEIAEYADRSTRALNKEIQFCACVLKIIQILSEYGE